MDTIPQPPPAECRTCATKLLCLLEFIRTLNVDPIPLAAQLPRRIPPQCTAESPLPTPEQSFLRFHQHLRTLIQVCLFSLHYECRIKQYSNLCICALILTDQHEMLSSRPQAMRSDAFSPSFPAAWPNNGRACRLSSCCLYHLCKIGLTPV